MSDIEADGDDWGSGGGDAGGDAGWDDNDNQKGAAAGGGGDDWDEPHGDDAVAADADASIDVQIANIFYEGEDLLRESPASSLAKFQQVVELASSNSDLSDESRSSYFSSLVHITKLQYELGSRKEMVTSYRQLLALIPRVTRNEASDAIDGVLNAVAHSADSALLEEVYSITSETVAKMADTERLLFSVNMRLCRTYMNKGDTEHAQQVLDKLLASCRTADGLDDKKNKGSELLEIYALSIKLSSSKGDSVAMRELYERTKDLSAAVKDPRSQSVIRECWGMMWGDDGQWKVAYTEFYSAFTHYQEIGNRDRAKQCLMYVVISNMLSGGDSNPFDAREAKVYQNEPDIKAIVNLRTAYEKCDVNTFNDSLNEINKANDKFIMSHLDSMIRDFQSRAVMSIVRSYRRIRLDSLASRLHISVSAVENIVVSLILDGAISGRVDQVNGLLDLTSSVAGGAKKYNAIHAWQQTLSHLSHTLTHAQLQSQQSAGPMIF